MSNENNLKHETSPYLLQHANNPVHWQPWGKSAFEKAKKEDKPIFLSIGYSTCHWCHVMAHESFEDAKVADILNTNFVSIKVDKEERPDIDSIYMNVCQTFTGSGGWPTTIFMTPDQKPFFAGTYFPKRSQYGTVGFIELLLNISDKWEKHKEELIKSGDRIIEVLNHEVKNEGVISKDLITNAVLSFRESYDKIYGGFGVAPKFPTPHNLMFLMHVYETTKDKEDLEMVEKTLLQMYKGGIFDHIGFGFSRYSTDRSFLAPHFEKMLYDNALLIISYIKAFTITKNDRYKKVAIQTADYVLRELTHHPGGFYCAQDADSDGVEGKYYVFSYDEMINLLGKDVGEKFNHYYDITKDGNFMGKNIPNLLKSTVLDDSFEVYLPKIYEYRKGRTKLHLDDKILTSWNSLMIVAFATMYRVLNESIYLETAKKACTFIENNLREQNTLFVSYRDGKRSGKGFLDDYAFYIYALITMYEASLDETYLKQAIILNNKAISDFYDEEKGGFYLYGKENEALVLKPKETFDGALPSGNSVMSYNLVKLTHITKDFRLDDLAQKQLAFMSYFANGYLAGYSFYLLALSIYLHPPKEIICVLKDASDKEQLKELLSLNVTIKILEMATDEYPLLNNKTTFYICKNHSCFPPTNDFQAISI